MQTEYTEAQDRLILKYAGTMPWNEIARRIGGGRNRHQIRGRHLHLKEQQQGASRAKPVKPPKDGTFEPTGRSQTVEQNGDNSQVVTSVDETIKTPEELIAARKIDLDVWKLAKATCGQYEGFFRDKSFPVGNGKSKHWHRTAKKVQLYTVKIWLERREEVEKHDKWLREQLIEDMRKYSPKPVHIIRKSVTGSDRFMLELAPFDHHFGKLCWAPETGEDFDLKIASNRFDASFDDLLGRAKLYPIEKILVTLGQDLLHVDNMMNTTTAGTPQDADGRWQKAFIRAKQAIVRNLEKCRQIAPVIVTVVPGNHDYQRSFYMGDTIESWFRNFDDVDVDNSPMKRKYVEYGATLLGISHGDEEKESDLKDLMNFEQAEAWARTRHHEWHLGHLHTRKETRYNKGDTHKGVVVRRLPSLTSTDAWHYKKGYVGNEHASEAYLWHRAKGFWGMFSHSAEAEVRRVSQLLQAAA